MSPHDWRVLGHWIRNAAHSAALLVALAAQAALVGWVVSGELGAVAALLVAVLALGTAVLASPRLVLRMYGARPLQRASAARVHDLVDTVARRAGMPVRPELYFIPSTIPNAISVGSVRRPAIAVTYGLLRVLDARGLTGVIAHEVSHVLNGDLIVMAVADAFARFTNVLAQIGLLLLLFGLILGDARLVPAEGLLVIGPTVSTLLMLALSRQREFAADLRAVRITGDPEGLARALVEIERPVGFWARLLGIPGRDPGPSMLRTHPATEARIRRLRALTPPRRPRRWWQRRWWQRRWWQR